jgi:rhodanese-related sulfurtransferase
VIGFESIKDVRCRLAVPMAVCLALAPLPLLAAHLHPVIGRAQLVDRLSGEQAPALIDIRTPAEYRSGHISGAINIPLQDFQGRFAELDAFRDREVVLYCETGARASTGGRWLKSRGFEELRILDGHMQAWRGAGLPTER